jgi:bifunctional non-homologous end joining protein LigD
MAATLTDERFQGDDWIFERKLDGIRLLAYKKGKSVKLFSRNQLLQNDHYPTIAKAVSDLPLDEAILDGEATGGYHIFDILWLNGRSVTGRPLYERQQLLREIPLKAPLHRVKALEQEKPWEHACAEGWEGVIAKRRDSLYEHRRSRQWLKMKCECAQEFVVGGFTDPQRSRVGFGALLVGYYQGTDFVFAGKVGTGFDTKLLMHLSERMKQLEISQSPFTVGTGLPRVRAHWVKPEIVVQVAFLEWTVHGKLRHSRLLGIRTDKRANEVVKE